MTLPRTIIIAITLSAIITIIMISIAIDYHAINSKFQDTELIKCIETRFKCDEFKKDAVKENFNLNIFQDGSKPSEYLDEYWKSDSITIIIEKHGALVRSDGSLDFSKVAKVKFENEFLNLTKLENNRIIEIVDLYQAKQLSILKIKFEKRQKYLRRRIAKHCNQ
jgi:hypothetical protein